MQQMTALLSTWEADRLGLFQGTPTAGQALDSILDMLRKRKIPLEPPAKAWPTWEEGKPYLVDERRLEELISAGHLPSRVAVKYEGVNPDRVEEMVERGTHVIVEMLDPVAVRRRKVKILDNVLVATRDGWDATKQRADHT